MYIRKSALADILGVDFSGLTEDPLYGVLDKLHPHRAAIETALVACERSLFNLDERRSISTISPRPILKASAPAMTRPSAATRAITAPT